MSELTKDQVLTYCKILVDEKISDLAAEVTKIEEAAANETKSSMGDKYETGREMLMQEKNKLHERLQLLADQKTALSTVSETQHEEVKHGSLITTDQAIFFIVTALGPVMIEGRKVFAISQSAPLAKELMGKKEGDEVRFNGRAQKVLGIE